MRRRLLWIFLKIFFEDEEDEEKESMGKKITSNLKCNLSKSIKNGYWIDKWKILIMKNI